MEQLPGYLKSDGSFTRTRRQREQDSFFTLSDGFQCFIDGIVLVKTWLPETALVFKRHLTKTMPPVALPGAGSAKGHGP